VLFVLSRDSSLFSRPDHPCHAFALAHIRLSHPLHALQCCRPCPTAPPSSCPPTPSPASDRSTARVWPPRHPYLPTPPSFSMPSSTATCVWLPTTLQRRRPRHPWTNLTPPLDGDRGVSPKVGHQGINGGSGTVNDRRKSRCGWHDRSAAWGLVSVAGSKMLKKTQLRYSIGDTVVFFLSSLFKCWTPI
jgi:hypothetical protein